MVAQRGVDGNRSRDLPSSVRVARFGADTRDAGQYRERKIGGVDSIRRQNVTRSAAK
jgi:hypothetical protein